MERPQNQTPKQDLELYKRLREESRRCAEDSFYSFFVHAWNAMEPQSEFKPNWHVSLLCEYLEYVKDREIKKLIINIPTRYLKSMICTVAFPAWVWTFDPSHRFINSSYSSILSTKLSYKRRQLIESVWYQNLWGEDVKLRDDANAKMFYENTAHGHMIATSTGGGVTGEGCDTMIIDDPTKPLEAVSEVQRERAIDHWKSTLSSRFNSPKDAAVVLVMQRLHERDLTGYFLAEEKGWEHLVIPNEAESKRIYVYPKSGRIKTYCEGEFLQPEREGRKELDNAKTALGSYNYAAQRLQQPAPLKGGLVKKDWFNFYDSPPVFQEVTISLDAAFKELETSDYVVFEVWGKAGANHYLIDLLRNKLSFTQTVAALKSLIMKYPAYNEILIEEKANGSAIIDTIKGDVGSIIPINPKDSKIARLNACTAVIEAGNVFLPNPIFNTWVNEFIMEVISFPKARHDDMVDAMTQYLNRQRARAVGVFDMERDIDEVYGTMAGSIGSKDW